MKRFLACSGGGDKGIIMVGMLLELYKSKGKEFVTWDEMAGISVGGILVAYISQTTPDTFEPMMTRLKDAFMENKIKVIKKWGWGGQFLNFVNAFMFHSSLYSNQNLVHTIHDWFDESKVYCPFSVGAYNKTLAEYETFSSSEHVGHMSKAILASASIPVVLPEVKIGSHMYQDGGMRHLIPVVEIKKWLHKMKDAGPKHIDILVCYPIHKFDAFIKMSAPMVRYDLVNESTRMVTDLMLEQLEMDLREIADICGVSFEEIHQTPCGRFEFGDTVVQILSPASGHFTSMLSMSKQQNKEYFDSGVEIAKEYTTSLKL